MNNSRSFLLLALLFVGYLIWNQWQQDYAHPAPAADAPVASAPVAGAANDTPTAPAMPAGSAVPAVPASAAAPASSAALVHVRTDVLDLAIDPHGGSIVRAELLAYPQQPKQFDRPVRLLDDAGPSYFVAQSGLVSNTGKAPDHQAEFSAEQTRYELAAGQDQIQVPLTWTDAASGLSVRKLYTLRRGSYVVEERQEIDNQGTDAWSGNAYRQLQRVQPVIPNTGFFSFNNPERYSFVGAAWYSPESKFKKLRFDKFAGEALNASFKDGWAAMLQHYFFAAWIPAAGETDQYATAIVTANPARYLIRTLGPAITVAPGASASSSARLYVGPKLQSTVDQIAPGLSLTADYGVLTFIAEPLHWVLSKIHALVGNWGFAIILLVLLIKALMFKLTEAQFRSMAKMRKLQPRVQALKDRYGEDRQKMNQAMLELYQKEKINPLGGCLPMLIQMPVFFALYWVLLESVELRQAPFVGWLQNLSAPDPYFVLPLLNGATMIVTQYLTPTTGMDPMQARMMKIMPVMFAVMFAFFPAGLVLYWTVNGMTSLLQQWIITKRIEAGEKA